MGSVSYTHLDVYKRQAPLPFVNPADARQPLQLLDQLPVSYTHLDVYKRQFRGHDVGNQGGVSRLEEGVGHAGEKAEHVDGP